jgi:ectoine hydroxylase-related dioxygenase (phytanoyl-CoA dioxygenase family)
MVASLSSEHVRHYARDGIAYPIPVMSAEEAFRFRTSFERFEACMDRRLVYAAMTHLFFGWAFDLASWPSILDVVEKILGPDPLIEGTLILCKHANDPSLVMWHQDFKYAVDDDAATVSVWVALTDSTSGNGCMRVIPGSHKAGILPHSDRVIEHNMLTYSTEVDESYSTDIELKAGEMSIHHPGIVHGSLPNRSDDKRIGFVIRFVTPQFSQTGNPLVRPRGASFYQLPDMTMGPEATNTNFDQNVLAWKDFVQQRNLLR